MPEARVFKNRLDLPLVPARWRVPEPAGLHRQRLLRSLENPWRHGLVMLVAPAGCGKTTLLGQFAAATGVPVAWFRAESSERDPAHFLRYLKASLSAALPDLPGDFSSVEGAAATLDRCRQRAVLVLDDLHVLEGSNSEEALSRLLRLLPRNLAVVAASRSKPKLNLSRVRLDGGLVIEAEELRFRAWEVERLFFDLYRDPLTPEDLASLTHKTSGWAAGLHLFHLATRGRSPSERRARLENLNGSSKLIREYLTDNVLQGLPAGLKDFLVETCVLGRLTGALCDSLRGTTGSLALLEDLEARQLLTGTAGDGYRCHDVLRSHLEAILVSRAGESASLLRYGEAGVLLEQAGDHADALYAFFRAENWARVGRLLANEGPRLASSSAPWIDLMPPPISAENPWLLLGAARRHRLAGRWHEAVATYNKAENAFVTQADMDTCRTERRAISIWLERPLDQLNGWDGLIRSATMSAQAPAGFVPDRCTPRGRVAAGVAALLSGNVKEAADLLRTVGEMPGASDALILGARLGETAAQLLQDPRADNELDSIVAEADRSGSGWLALVARAVLALTGREEGLAEARSVRVHFSRQEDAWGRSLAGLLEGVGRLVAGGHPGSLLETTAQEFRSLGATTLEAWCLCLRALSLARSNDPDARNAALGAESVARSAHLSGPLLAAYEALALTEPDRAQAYLELAREIRTGSGLGVAAALEVSKQSDGATAPLVEIRCFGEFRICIAGRQLNLKTIKPRARQLLRLLALNFSRPVHLEVIGDALWPESDREIVRRNLQVAVHSVRKLLGSVPLPSGNSLLARDGESYRLELPEGSVVDLRKFERSLAEGRQARAARDNRRASDAFQRALDLHCGDLLSEDGPAEWVVMERERCRAQAVEAAQCLADAFGEIGDLDAAVRACERGLRMDRFQDNLWRRLISIHRRAGNRAAELRAELTYSAILAELGLEKKPAI